MTIVTAIDEGDTARAIVEQGAKLADAFDEPLHIVHAFARSDFVDIELDAVERTGRPLEMEKVKSLAADIARDAADGIDRNYEAVGLMGGVAQEILEYAASEDATYLVIGGRKRTPVGKALFGSVTQSVLLEADRPVLTVMAE